MGRSPDATPVQPADSELNFLREWREPRSARAVSYAVGGSIAFHALAFLSFWLLPEIEPYKLPLRANQDIKRSVVLIVPRDLIRGPVPTPGADFSRPQQKASAPPRVQPPRFRPPAPRIGQPAANPTPAQAPMIEAPPDSITAPPAATALNVPLTLPAPAPKPPAPKPKATFEPVGGPPPPSTGASQTPTPAEAALRAALRNAGTVQIPSDASQDTSGLPELRSDPKGVDFTQYLVQVRTKVKRNWLAVIPEDARKGRRGVVQIDFAIDRRGVARGVKIFAPSGVQSFDLAAVAGITSSYPFPPLPAEYKGDEIDLRMTFTYATTNH